MMQIIFKAVTGSFGHAPWWEGKNGTVRARDQIPSHLNRESIYIKVNYGIAAGGLCA